MAAAPGRVQGDGAQGGLPHPDPVRRAAGRSAGRPDRLHVAHRQHAGIGHSGRDAAVAARRDAGAGDADRARGVGAIAGERPVPVELAGTGIRIRAHAGHQGRSRTVYRERTASECPLLHGRRRPHEQRGERGRLAGTDHGRGASRGDGVRQPAQHRAAGCHGRGADGDLSGGVRLRPPDRRAGRDPQPLRDERIPRIAVSGLAA